MQFASTECCCKVVMVPELVAEVCPSQSLYAPVWAPECLTD